MSTMTAKSASMAVAASEDADARAVLVEDTPLLAGKQQQQQETGKMSFSAFIRNAVKNADRTIVILTVLVPGVQSSARCPSRGLPHPLTAVVGDRGCVGG